MNIKRMSSWTAALWVLAASPGFAWTCTHGSVEIGARAQSVREKCGAPDFVYTVRGRTAGAHAAAYWYYDSGPTQLVRVLRLQGGVLVDSATAGYGLGAQRVRCTPADIHPGMQVYELVRRCGPPLRRAAPAKTDAKTPDGHREIWTYDFGPQYLLQRVTLLDTRVYRVATTGRGGSKPRR
ncbi:MAG: DUF2845 domain-containing protein [Gammaproteobacteria bacterium]